MKLQHIRLLNVLMCFCVVTVHLTSAPVTELRKDSLWYLLFFVVNKVCSLAVPAFLFLSGFKLYYKYQNTKTAWRQFYAGRARKILLPYAVAVAVYFAFYMTQDLTRWEELLPGLFLGTLAAHFYYIIIAVQFYLLFPLLLYLFEQADKLLVILSFVSTVCFHQFFFFVYSDRFFATYIFYFVLGMLIAKYRPSKRISPAPLYAVLYLLAAAVHIFLCYRMSLGGFWYRNSGVGQVVYVTAGILFLYNVCLGIGSPGIHKVAAFFDPHTFYIFLYHILVMNVLQFVILPHFAFSVKYRFLIISVVVLGVIFLYCLLMDLIQKKKRLPAAGAK